MTQAAPLSWPVDSAAPAGTPASVSAACRFIGHDLVASHAIRDALPAIAWWLETDELLPPGFVVLGVAKGADLLVGFGLDPARPVAHVVAEVADRVQQHLNGYEFLQWPSCADGRHVLQPTIVAGAAVWSCAGQPEQRIRIGEWSSEN
jgi:hypothetical protein